MEPSHPSRPDLQQELLRAEEETGPGEDAEVEEDEVEEDVSDKHLVNRITQKTKRSSPA